jgi:hypothetical protein
MANDKLAIPVSSAIGQMQSGYLEVVLVSGAALTMNNMASIHR